MTEESRMHSVCAKFADLADRLLLTKGEVASLCCYLLAVEARLSEDPEASKQGIFRVIEELVKVQMQEDCKDG